MLVTDKFWEEKRNGKTTGKTQGSICNI